MNFLIIMLILQILMYLMFGILSNKRTFCECFVFLALMIISGVPLSLIIKNEFLQIIAISIFGLLIGEIVIPLLRKLDKFFGITY